MLARQLTCFVILLAASGCFVQHLSSSQRLQEAVQGLNDEARWGRLDLAVGCVAPRYRNAFYTSRSRWSRSIQIADVEISQVVMGEKGRAVSVVMISWYDFAAMDLRQTLLRQRWQRGGSRGFMLVSEDVIDGDPQLVASPKRHTDDEGSANVESIGAKRVSPGT
jgi:hypothetical protein